MSHRSDTIEKECARALVYRSLADVFHPPGPGLPRGLANLEDALGNIASSAMSAARAMRSAIEEAENQEMLEVDYAQLFVGPFLVLAPPYGSVYLEGERRIMGDSTMDALLFYRDSGFDLAPDFKEAPDHIAAELEFLHALVCREVQAMENDDREGALEAIERQGVFLERHLGAWGSAFAGKIREKACCGFYRHAAETMRRFVEEEREALSIPDKSAASVAAQQHA